ncbi:MAG: hypothetical protein IJ867_02635 [Clostridia bacterium]|nr:hypothetical protein [Clostridia bacterium]
MKMRKFWILILILCFGLICLTGCKETSENLALEKGLSEVRYLENQCVSIFSKYLSGEYVLENGEIDWGTIREEYEVVYRSTDVIMIDLAGLQVPSKDIVELESRFQELDLLYQERDIDGFMRKICDCYSLVSNSILSSISNDSSLKLEKSAKAQFLYFGYCLQVLDKPNALATLLRFQEFCTELNKNQVYLENNSYKINRIFVDIQKMRGAIEVDDFEKAKGIFLEMLDFI